MKQALSKRNILILMALPAVGIMLAAYAFFDPAEGGFPECLFHKLTGFDCPGCGTQRALHSLLHGDIAGALRYNALLALCVPLLMVLCLPPKVKWAERLRGSVWLPKAVLIVVLGWWIVRNLL